MDSQRYNIIFEGKVADGVDMEIAKGNLQRLFKTDRATVDKLFSGKRTVLKKNVSADTLKKYQTALTNAGVECTADPDISTTATPVAPVIDARNTCPLSLPRTILRLSLFVSHFPV